MNIRLKRKYGFTLIEVLVASGLLAMMVAFLSYMVISAMRAQEFERSVRTAATATREAMNRMADELRLAAILPSAGSSSLSFVGSSNVPSGVILPDSYDSSITMDSSVKKTTGNKGVCYIDDRLIFTRPKMEASMSGKDGANYVFDPSDVRNYVYVEWMVPKSTPDRIWRRVYNINNGTKCGHTASEKKVSIDSSRKVDAVIWMFNSSYFADANNRVKAQGSSANNEADWLVMSLNPGNTSEKSFSDKKLSDTSKGGAFARNKATITFRVSHPIYHNPSNNTNIEPQYYTTYNRNLFNIKFQTKVYKDAKGADERSATKIDLETQVRLQAGA